MQRERRRDPYPWTWEPWAAAGFGALLGAVVGLQLGRTLANLVTGHGWTWPAADRGAGFHSPLGAAFWSSLPGILGGNAGAGLPHPTPVAGPLTLWICLALTEALLLGALIWAGRQVHVRWGPGRMRGMATAAQAEKLLGRARVRKVAHVVRPDLYEQRGRWIFKHTVNRRSDEPAAVHHEAGDPRAQPGTPLGQGLSPWLLNRDNVKEPR